MRRPPSRWWSVRFQRTYVVCVDRRLYRIKNRALQTRRMTWCESIDFQRSTENANLPQQRRQWRCMTASSVSYRRRVIATLRVAYRKLAADRVIFSSRIRSFTNGRHWIDPGTSDASAACLRLISLSVPLSHALHSLRRCRQPRIDCDAPSATSRDVYQHV